MAKYVVIAGTCPDLQHVELLDPVNPKDEHVKRRVPSKKYDVFDGKDIDAGALQKLINEGFLEPYEPHTITEADAKLPENKIFMEQHLVTDAQTKERRLVKVGDEIHMTHSGFTIAQVEEPKKEPKADKK